MKDLSLCKEYSLSLSTYDYVFRASHNKAAACNGIAYSACPNAVYEHG
jgi:hypothetical protein